MKYFALILSTIILIGIIVIYLFDKDIADKDLIYFSLLCIVNYITYVYLSIMESINNKSE